MLELNNMYKLEMMVPYQLSCVSTEKTANWYHFNYQTLWNFDAIWLYELQASDICQMNVIQTIGSSKVPNGVKMDVTIARSWIARFQLASG